MILGRSGGEVVASGFSELDEMLDLLIRRFPPPFFRRWNGRPELLLFFSAS